MEIAKSLRYGLMVKASEAEYRMYSEWQLVCPCCHEPVFLSSSTTRSQHTRLAPKTKQTVLVKEAKVSSSFHHFNGLASEECDNYNSRISDGDVKRFAALSRQQRLEKYNVRFLELMGYNKKMFKGKFFNSFKSVNSNLKNANIKLIQDFTSKDFIESFEPAKAMLSKHGAEKFLEVRQASNPDKFFDCSKVSGITEEDIKRYNLWMKSVDIDLHLVLCGEVFDFLTTKAAKLISVELLDMATMRLEFKNSRTFRELIKFRSKADKELYQYLILQLTLHMAEIIFLNDWSG